MENTRLHEVIQAKDAIILEYQRSCLISIRTKVNDIHAANSESNSNNLSVQNTASSAVNQVQQPQISIRNQNSTISSATGARNRSNNPPLNVKDSSESLNQLSISKSAAEQLSTRPSTNLDQNLQTEWSQSQVQATSHTENSNCRSDSRHTSVQANQSTPHVAHACNSSSESLPQFDGSSHKKWIAYERTYQFLKSRGVSSDELVSKLNASLEGEAYDLVQDLLLIRADSDLIISQLKEQYGDYDRVIIEISREIQNIRPLVDRPKHEIWELALKLKTYVTHVKAYGRTSELNNLLLCEEVVDKLRPEHQDMWGTLLRSNPRASIEELSKMLLQIARLPSCRKSSNPSSEPLQTRKYHNKDVVEFICPFCKDHHKLKKCQMFINLSLPQRYNFVNNNNICTACLISSDHTWQNCPNKRTCQLAGCTNFHHRLLHRFVEKSS